MKAPSQCRVLATRITAHILTTTFLSGLVWVSGSTVTPLPANAQDADWVATSDANTQLVTEFYAQYLPEIMGSLGAEGFDEEIQQISTAIEEEAKRRGRLLVAELKQRQATEPSAAVRQDLDILIDTLERDLRSTELEERLLLPYFDIGETVFRGFRALLDEQVA